MWQKNWAKVCDSNVWRQLDGVTLKSQECWCVVEILQTFQRGPHQLCCLFPSDVCQLGFETKSGKLSKMWLPPLNFTQADQRQLLEGGICSDLSLHLSFVSRGAILSDTSLSSKDPIYMPSYPCTSGAQQTLHTIWHHLEAISNPPPWHAITWEETLSKSCVDT